MRRVLLLRLTLLEKEKYRIVRTLIYGDSTVGGTTSVHKNTQTDKETDSDI